ncbi:MAG: hypothetical protein NVS4B13_10100 [Candidatus Elarobacter sp.]
MTRSITAGALVAFVALTTVPAQASPTDDVRAAMLRLAGLSSYELSFGMSGQTGVMDFVKPDDFRMKASGMEMVRVNKVTYLRMGPGKWTKLPETSGSKGAGPMDISDHIRTMAKQANAITATDLGMKSVDGETLHAYRMKDNGGTQSTVYIAADGLVHRVDNGGREGSVRFSKFNGVAPIRAPI